MAKYSKILIALNVVLVILNISLLTVVYSDRSSVDSGSVAKRDQSSTVLVADGVENDESKQRGKKVNSTPNANDVVTEQFLVDADAGVGIESQSAIDTIKPGSTNDERLASAEQIDAAISFKNTYSSTKEKLEELLVTGGYQQGS